MGLQPLPPDPWNEFDPRHLNILLDLLDRHTNEQAEEAGGMNKQVPRRCRLVIKYYAYDIELRDNSGMTHTARPRWFEVSTALQGMRRCSSQLRYRPAKIDMYRYIVPQLPTMRRPIIQGYMELGFDSLTNASASVA